MRFCIIFHKMAALLFVYFIHIVIIYERYNNGMGLFKIAMLYFYYIIVFIYNK